MPHLFLTYEKFCVGPWVVQYLNNHVKFQKLQKNKEKHDFTLFASVPMAMPDA